MKGADDINGSSGFFETASTKYQYVLDKLSPHYLMRWAIFAVVFTLYFLRVYLVNGWYIVSYGLGIYLLNQLIGFISPQVCNPGMSFIVTYYRFESLV